MLLFIWKHNGLVLPIENQRKYVGNMKQTEPCAYSALAQKLTLLEGMSVMTCARFMYKVFPNRNRCKCVGNLKETKLCAYDVLNQKQKLVQGRVVVIHKLFVYNVVFVFRIARTTCNVSRADLASFVKWLLLCQSRSRTY